MSTVRGSGPPSPRRVESCAFRRGRPAAGRRHRAGAARSEDRAEGPHSHLAYAQQSPGTGWPDHRREKLAETEAWDPTDLGST
jgi:hypothetical protein